MDEEILEVDCEDVVFDEFEADISQEASFDAGGSDVSGLGWVEVAAGGVAGGLTD